MSTADQWTVGLSISELDDQTNAEARLIMGDDDHLCGRGRARRNPADQNVTRIGEEVAVARALPTSRTRFSPPQPQESNP